jgi:hypothetical protein
VDVEGVDLVARCGTAGVRVTVAGDPAAAGAALDPGGADWLPEGLHDLGRGGVGADEQLDLDLVRAVVAVAWAARDRGMGLAGVARIEVVG